VVFIRFCNCPWYNKWPCFFRGDLACFKCSQKYSTVSIKSKPFTYPFSFFTVNSTRSLQVRITKASCDTRRHVEYYCIFVIVLFMHACKHPNPDLPHWRVVQQCRDLFHACGSAQKKLHVFPHAGHNDLILTHETAYFAAVAALMDQGSSLVHDPHDFPHRQDCSPPPVTSTTTTMVSTLLSLYHQKQYQRLLKQVKTLTTTSSDATSCRDVNTPSVTNTPIETQKIVFEVAAKASWHVQEWANVIRYTSDTLSIDPKDVNALTLRAKAYLECNDVASAQADAIVLGTMLLQTTASSSSSSSTSSSSSSSSDAKASLAMALMAIHFWNVQ
jgi:hypothetical protein